MHDVLSVMERSSREAARSAAGRKMVQANVESGFRSFFTSEESTVEERLGLRGRVRRGCESRSGKVESNGRRRAVCR